MSDLERLRKDAKIAYKGRAYGDAAELYRQILDEPVRDPAVLVADRTGYASALAALNQLDAAAVQLEMVLAQTPDDARLRHKMGEILSRLGRHAEAADHLAEAVRVEPDNADHHWRLAVELRALGRDDESAAELRRCLTLNPNHTEAQLWEMERALLEAPERDGQVEEGDGERQTIGFLGSRQPPQRPGRQSYQPPRMRHKPAFVIVEAVGLVLIALWLKASFG